MAISRSPTGADLICAICHSPGQLDIDHIQNRGMGGSKARDVPENKIPLCRRCHDMKTRNRIKAWVEKGFYCWQAVPSRGGLPGQNTIFRVPIEISKRYGCLVLAEEEAS